MGKKLSSDIMVTYPIRKCLFEEHDGLVTVLFKNPKPNLFEKVLFKNHSKKPYKIDLDEIGSFVWFLCDGNNTVSDIVKKSKEHFGDKIDPAESRVKLFVQQLAKNKFVQLFEKR